MGRRGIRFQAKSLELGRQYMWRKEFLPLLYNYLELRPGQSVLDVGCGTGFFTRLVAAGLKAKGRVVGVDRNSRLLAVARRLVAKSGPNGVISFRKGEAQSLPFKDGSFDRVVCQTLLWTTKDPRVAIREMVRVCKPGGLIGAVEGGFDYTIFYFPEDPRLTKLERKWALAITRGYRKVYGADRGIGYKLPALFRESGLKRVRLDGYPYIWLEGDDRVPIEHKIQGHKLGVEWIEKKNQKRREGRRLLLEGGMTAKEIAELDRYSLSRSLRLLKNPFLIESDTSVNAGIFFITTGVKDR